MTLREPDPPVHGHPPLPPARPAGEGAARKEDLPPTRRILDVGPAREEWIVTWVGSALAAVPHSSRVALLELEAVPAARPEKGVRRLLMAGRSLDEVADEEIAARLTAKPDSPARTRHGRERGRTP